MKQLTIGSLFSGFGGLDRAVENVFNARTVWVSDIEPGPCKVLAHRFPGVPNLGDIARIDWAQVEPVDIIAGGSPCQDISSAGRMAGMYEGTRSNLWVCMRDAIATLRPRYVIWENVYAARSTKASSKSLPGHIDRAIDHHLRVSQESLHVPTERRHRRAAHRLMESRARLVGVGYPQPALRALGRVLGDLASLGFDAEWHSLRAADIGAPHGRARFFVVAANTAHVRHERPWPSRVGWAGPADRGSGPVALLPTPRATRGGSSTETVELLPTPSAGNFNASEDPDQWEARRQRVKETTNNGNGMGMPLGIAVQLLPTPNTMDGMAARSDEALARARQRGGCSNLKDLREQDWGRYAAAIARWEAIVGPAPAPTKPGRTGRPKLNPAFSEWLMGAPTGWITDTPGVTDNEALRMAGNGVVQQQAESALRLMLTRMGAAA